MHGAVSQLGLLRYQPTETIYKCLYLWRRSRAGHATQTQCQFYSICSLRANVAASNGSGSRHITILLCHWADVDILPMFTLTYLCYVM